MAKYKPNIARLYPQSQTPRPSMWDLANQQDIKRRMQGGGYVATDSDVLTLLSTAGASGELVASGSVLEALDNYVIGLKAQGIWSKLDCLWVFATNGDANFALRNIKSPNTFTCLAVSSPVFTENEGYKGDGASDYLNTQFTPSTDGVNYTQDSASFGFYARTTSTVNSDEMGCVNTVSGNAATITARLTNNFAQFDINSNSGLTGATTDGLGFYHAERYNASNMRLYKNGSSIRASAITSTGLPDQEMYILAKNSNGSNADESDAQISIAFIGGSLLSEASVFSTLTETYMDAIGKGVVA